jgi:hypothetical protein
MEILIGMKGLKIACNYIKVNLFFSLGGVFLHFFNLEIIILTHKKDFCEKNGPTWPYFKKRESKISRFLQHVPACSKK